MWTPKDPKGQDPLRSRKTKRDDSVMATNNSSIVSKRSVERLYYPEPHLYRYFVKKPLRRSPLINRGYWLRMHAVEQVIKQFLEQPSEKQKIILNLGCGYDPLAFQWLSKGSSFCQNVRFFDIDFPDLIAKKCNVITGTPQLRDWLGPYERPSQPNGIYIRSETYVALGCDLADNTRFDELLADEVDSASSLVLCTAEVSITYMDFKAANALIRWGAKFDDIRFCLLEQYLPDGPDYPFARKMIQHFNNLQTPLKAIHAYPGLRDQEQRFSQAGWSTAIARSLWDVWNDSIFVSKSQRLALNDVEPFDEWEEFVLFASHYFLLIADRGPSLANPLSSEPLQEKASPNPMHDPRDKSITATSEALPKSNMRRFGALAQLSSDSVGHHGGLGPQSRIGTMDIYSLSESGSVGPPDADKIKPRMCHSITISGHGSLLIGGRTSPDHALQDCWLLHRNHWIRVEDLPTPLFRHCATEVVLEGAKDCSAVLAYGGKTRGNQVCNKWFLWREHGGWIEVIATEHELRPRFGAAMISTGKCTGILLGGMESDGTILDEFWEWTLLMDEKLPKMTLTKCEVLDIHRGQSSEVRSTRGQSVSRRMGACLTKSTMGILLIGGVASDVLAQGLEIVCLSRKSSDNPKVNSWHCTTIDCLIGGSRPLLVGHSAVALHDSVTVVGGGAVCFSFGTFWNTTVIALSVSEKRMIISSKASHQGRKPAADDTLSKKSTNHRKNAQDHPRHSDATSTDKVRLQSPEDFEKVLGRRRPVIIEIMGLGLCTATWTLDTLKAKIGGDRKVVVHEATDAQMDFQQKNFQYTKKPFSVFADEIADGSRQYLRSLASENPSGQPANFWVDFPELADDFVLPPQFDIVDQNMHSSVLRISGPVTMWLHYDVMANVLCQIRGTKRLILYPPSDVSLFLIPPGASSSSVDCFDADHTQYPSLALAHPFEVLLEPGDVLFIPPLWFHTASPVDDISISVNVFFSDLDSGYAPGRDVYGNRDVQAYEKGRKDIEKITQSFDKLPPDMARFYLERLADELKAKALKIES